MKFYEKEKRSAAEAKFEAQKIAFAPFVFQASLALRNLGILQAVEKKQEKGALVSEVSKELKLPEYGVKVLMEAGLGIGLFYLKENRFLLSNTGHFVLHDEMTRVNMDFVQDVNYRGFFHLEESVRQGMPAGLKVFGEWKTIYEGLSHLPEHVQRSWFSFDHFYSDEAFKDVLPVVFKDKPKRIMDIGGNTGRWALQCLQYDPEVLLTIVDLPGQLRMAEKNIAQHPEASRVSYHASDILQASGHLPPDHDVIWMSQFLDCFSKEQIISILQKISKVIPKTGSVYILETYWDRQKYEAAAFCLQQTSLYFTCMANGNSQMYRAEDMKECLSAAGFKISEEVDGIGISHTLFKCQVV